MTTIGSLPEKHGLQVKAAVEAIPKLHKAVIQTGKAGGKKQGQHALRARQLKGEGSIVKKWRVIMRNLPFNVSRNDASGSPDLLLTS